MSSGHTHSHTHDHFHGQGLTFAFWLNFGFTIIEVVGGILTNSTAILTDAIHDFGDTLAIGAGIWLEKVSGKKRTPTYSYGYKRFSLLSALLLSVFLLTGSGIMLVKSIMQLFHPETVDEMGMLWLSVLGVSVNGLAFWRMSRHEKLHDHGINHNRRAITLHFLEDVLGWVAVLVGAVIIHYTHWFWVDPLLSALIAVFIISRAIPNLKHTLKIFLQAVPDSVDLVAMTREIGALNGVKNLHDLHTWTLEGTFHVLTMHVVIAETSAQGQHELREQIETVLRRYHIRHSTLQIEFEEEKHCGYENC